MILLSATALAAPQSNSNAGALLKAPVAAFSAHPTSGYAPLKVAFTDKSTGFHNSYKWSFGDGTYSKEKNPVHKYTKVGSYTVSLTVSNAAGNNTTTKSNFIVVNALKAPVAAFVAHPTSGYAPFKVLFTDKSTGVHNSFKWSFGDGTYSREKNPVHKYAKAGNYTVSLTVSNAAGNNTATKSNYIVVKTVKAPVAAFTAYPISGKAPLKVIFIDKSTGVHDSWKWNFGDNSFSTEKTPVHKYTKAGNYTVSLTVSNAGGSNTKTISNYIKVKSK
jgi:PKD repeat protein